MIDFHRGGALEHELRREFETALRHLFGRSDAVASIDAATATIYLHGIEEAKLVVRAVQAASRIV